MNDIMSNKIPRQKNAAIFPATGILLISNKNNLSSVNENRLNETIRITFNLWRIPSHISAKDNNPHNIGKPVLT